MRPLDHTAQTLGELSTEVFVRVRGLLCAGCVLDRLSATKAVLPPYSRTITPSKAHLGNPSLRRKS